MLFQATIVVNRCRFVNQSAAFSHIHQPAVNYGYFEYCIQKIGFQKK